MKAILKYTLLCNLLLFPVGRQTYACDGPCIEMNDHCGDAGGGQGTCRMQPWVCIGNCPSYCPAGLVPDEYCDRRSGKCDFYTFPCSVMRNCACRINEEGTACVCVWVTTSGNCYGQGCRD